MAQNIEIPVSLGLKDAQAQINQLRQSLQQSVKLDSTAGKGLIQILNNAQKMVDNLTGKMSTSFKSASSSSSFLKDYEKMIGLLTTVTEKMTNLGVTDIKFSVADQQTVDSTIQKIQSLQASLESIQSGKAIEVINMSQVDGIDNLRQKLTELKLDASKLTFDEIGTKLGEAASKADANVQKLTNDIANINSQMNKLNIQGFTDISKLSDFSTKGVARILDAGNVDSVNNKLQKLASTMAEITVKPMTVTAGQNIDSVIESQTRAIEKKYNEQIQVIQQNKEKITAAITQVTEAGMRTAANGKTSSGHWTNEQMQTLMSMPSVENIINRLKADTTLNFDNLGIRQQFAKFREALNEELNSLNTKGVNLQGLRDNVKNQVTEVFEGAGEAIVGNRSQLQSSIKSIFSNLGINGDELKKIFDINSISSGDKMVDVIDRIKQGLTSYIDTLDKTANTDLSAKLKEAQASFDGLTQAQNTNKSVSQESGNAAQTLQDQINTLAQQIQDLINKYNQLTGQNINFDTGNIEGAKGHIESYIQSLNKLQQKQQALGNIQSAVNRWMGFWQVLNMTKSAINDMKQHIQELDTVMTSISVVTNFSQEDLWGQISQYSEIARQYGVAIKGVYEVSQIYYQQGLQQNDVMTLTTETLKMARIAGLDYATAADYMTTAIRGFKLEMQDAAHVTDVFSALAATTASSTEEIAVAISKTASSAEAVGASFEATSAMMATMIATTRESATNIGTALKSVISRYGEMTSDPSKTVDSEGEEMSLNRVDKALQTVGITIHDTAGQFRDFDDVMLELMEKWDSLDSLSQRYIATLMAGNRQQSRFLALVSNVDEYKKALETATNAEGTGELQTLKTLDSIDAKIEKMKVTIQEFYTSSGLEELYKNVIDAITNIVSAGNSLPKFFDKIPGLAVALGFQIVATIKSVLSLIIAEIQLTLNRIKGDNNTFLTGLIQSWRQAGEQAGTQASTALSTKLKSVMASKAFVQFANIAGSIIQLVGSAKITQGMTQYGASTSVDQDREAARTTLGGTVTSMIGGAVSGAAMGAAGGVPGIVIGALGGIVTSLPSLVTALNMNNVNLARKIELDKKAEAKAKEDLAKDKGEEKSLQTALDQLNQLKAAQYDSAEAAKEYTDYMNQLGDQYPNLIDYMNQSGDAIISVTKLEAELARARGETAASTVTALKKEQERLNHEKESAEKLGSFDLYKYDDNMRSLYDEFGDLARKQDLKSKTFFSHENEAALVTAWMEAQGWNTGTKQQIKRYNEISTGQHRNERAVDFLQNNELRKQILNWSIEHYGAEVAGDNTLATLIRSKLKTYIEESKDDKILGWLGLESTDEISGNMTYSELFQLGKQIQIYSNNLVNTTQATLQNVADTLVSAEISEEVQSRLNEMANSNDQKQKDNSNKLQKYISLMSFIYSGMGDAIPDKNTMAEFEKWLLKDEERADKLLNLDYSKFRNITDIASYLGEEVDGDFFSTYGKALQTQLQAIRKEEIEGLEEQLQKSNLTGKFEDLYDNTGNNELISALIPTFRADVTKYQSLMDKGLYAQAEAYLHNMEQLYGPNGIGSLSSELQTEAFSVIKDLDLSDPEALRSAAETFAEMGPEFKGLSDQFTSVALRWATSAATLLEQLSSSTQETAKSIESSTSDMSKVFKYSEALEKAQALMDANEGAEFKELFTYDKDLGGYVKTAKAFQLEMAEFENKQYEDINRSINDYKNFMPNVSSSNTLRATYIAGKTSSTRAEQAKSHFADLIGLNRESDTYEQDLDRLWQEYTQMVDEFEATDEDTRGTWDEFTKEYLQKRGSDLAEQLKEIQQMPQEMAQQALQSFDYASIASGKGTVQDKETLKALLSNAGNINISDEFFDKYYTELIKGNFDQYNNWLESVNLSEFKVSEGQTNRARFESLTSLYQKIASGDVVWDALTQQEQELLNSVEGVNLTEGANAAQVGAAADNVWTAIIKLIQAGAGTLNEVADTIAGKADKDFKDSNAGKQYNLLTSYKDGFTSQEAQELGLLDDNGKLKFEFSSYLERDSNGNWIAKAGQDAASVIQELARLLNISLVTTTDEYKDAIKDGIDQAIAEADKADIGKQRVNAWQSVMSGKISDRISLADVDATTKSYMKAAGLISDLNADFVYIQSEEQLNKAIEWMRTKVADKTWVSHNKQTARYFDNLVKDFDAKANKINAVTGVISQQVSRDAAESFALAFEGTTEKASEVMERMGAVWDNLSQSWIIDNEDLDDIEAYIDALEKTDDGTNATAITQMRTSLANLRDTFAYDENRALIDLIENYSNVSNEAIAKFNQYYGEQLQTAGKSIDEFIITDELGNKTLKVVELQKALTEAGNNVDDLFKDAVASYADTYLESIEKVQGYVKSGTTSRAEMETFAQQFEEVTGDAVDIDTAFEYDSEIKAWKLGSDYLIRYAYARGQQLGMIDDEYKDYVEDLLKEDVTSSIQEVLSNINNQNRRQELDDALFNYYRNLFQSDPSKIEGGRQAVSDLAQTTTERWKELQARGGGIIASVEGLAGGLVDHTIAQLQETAKAEESTEEQIIQMAKAKALETRETILKGGEKAVNAYKEINENATAEELEQIYNFAANPLRQAYDDLGKKAGETVSGLAAEIMKVSEGFEIQELADGTAVITAVGDMVQAYGNLYKRMEGIAGVTTSDLNNIYASLLTANDQKEIDAIELLSSAEGMTYQALGEMLSKYGHKLEDWVNKPGEHGIELLGAGKVRIDDWDKVATSLGLEGGTQEYIDAYKAYNDEQIEYQNKIKDSIKSEIDTLKNAKSGDFINLTQIWKSYGEAFEVALTKAGISEQFKKGILEIKSSADIPKLLQEIGDIAAASQDLIPSELAELSDAIASFLEGLTDLISQGISGGLSYVDKNNLIEQARSQLGVNDLEFVQTADGFQLVETSALKLYDALKKVNSFAAGKLFEGLREQLEKVNENFESSSALTAYISSTRQDILNTDNKVSNARKEQYKEELDIAKEILAVRATSEDDSFNFMNQDIPAGQNNPLNYMASWKTAFDSIKQAKRTGHMDYKDFYNFVTEVGHLAEITGKAIPLGKKSVENSQQAADLITQAASQLKTVEQDGSYKINLSGLKQIGIDFAAGAQGMSDGIDEGIHQMAQSQIDMLDGLISLLETIVQMEKLSDIDVEGDGIDIEDIFKINYEGKAEYTPIYDEWREDMRQKFQDYLDSKDPKTGKATVNVDLGRFIEGASFQADGEWVNFSDMLNMPASELAKKSTEFQTAYAALINSLVQASLSGNYDVDSIMQSVSQVLAESGVTDLELDLGNMHLSLVGGKISTVTYNKEEYEKLIKSGKTQRQISEAVSKFNHGEGLKDTSFTITDILKLVHNIAYKVENGKTYITSPDGSEQVEIPANGDLSNRAKQMANAWALKEQGLDTSKINYTDNGDAVEVTTTIGLKPGIKVRASGDGEITWNPDDDTIDIDGTKVTPTGNNQEEYLQSIIDQYRKKTGQGEKIITDEEILWKSELKIRAQLSSSLVDKNGKALNTSGDPKLVQEISDKAKEVRQMTDDQLQKAFQPDKSGNYTIDIGGKQYTIRAEDITVDGKIDAEKAANTLFSASGLDAALQANISSAIVSGFESLSTTLEGLNAEPVTNVANAIQSIGTNADTTAGKVEKLVETLGKLGNFGSSEKPSNKDNKSVDEKLAVKEAEVSVPEVTSDFKDTEITIPDGTEVTAKDGSRVIIDNDIMAEPHSLNPFDMTYLPTDFGNQQVKAGSMMRIDNPIKAIVKEIELDLSEAKPKIYGPVNKDIEKIGKELQTSEKNISDSSSSAAESVPKAFSSPMQQAVDIVGQAVASILSHITTMTAQSTDAFTSVKEEVGSIQQHVPITWTIGINFDNPIFDAWFSGRGFEGLGSNAEHLTEEMTVNANTKGAEETANKAADYISTLSPDITVNAVDGGVAGQVAEILDKLPKTHSITIETTGGNSNGGSGKLPSRVITTNGTNSSTGNFAMSKGTLMGELGPELVVSNGHYFVAGQNGAEMVDLADDAIVFNHLQTEQLLKRGMSPGRGRAVTNERNAVAFAQGNVDGGPAMASASAALNALKQLRAMWESLLGASVSDLAGGGGGGGGGSKVIDPKAWIDTVERWYNLMQEIARLEQQITHEEKLRAKLQSDFQKNGKAYYTSQKLSVDSLEQQIQAQEQLNLSREDYLDRRIAALQNNSFGKIYRFDPETKQLEFQKGEGVNLNGFDNAMEFLTDLYGFNEQGKANYTNKQKYEILKANGFGEQMLYKDGMEIKADSDNSGDISDEEWESFYEQATEAFRDRMDEYAQATQSLRDEIQKGKDQLLELQTQVNEILQDMRDNQMDVENKVLDAIVDLREREIDALQDERDKLEESVNKYVDGLSNALDKEQKMYQNQESQNDLDKQRRRLAILQRSGGSASDIANLQNDINQSERDMYFDLQQQQIDAIQEASQLELERMDTQIEIMNETLEFQKEYGLLWEEVYNIMGGSAAQITDFISGNSEFWSKSPLATSEEVNKIFFGAEQWTSYRDNIEDWNKVREALFNQIKAADKQLYNTSMIQEFGENYDPTGKYAQIFEQSYNEYGDVTKASTAARSAYTADKLAAEEAERKRKEEDERKRREQEAAAAAAATQAAPAVQTSGGGNEGDKIIDGPKWVSDGASGCHQEVTWKKQGKLRGGTQKHNFVSNGRNQSCTRCGYFKTISVSQRGLREFASGGYVDHGVYELGERGTETVLTASQTKVLRDNILSNRPSSLISLLKTYNEGFAQNHLDSYSKDAQALYNSVSNNDGITIENATVNMNVQQLANDYDAKRAGEQALAEIMRIARKTSANNSIRR